MYPFYSQDVGNYRVEYARSSRSGCLQCKNRSKSWASDRRSPILPTDVMIKGGELRLGTQSLVRGIPIFSWNHWGCITPEMLLGAKNKYPEVSQLDGYDEMRDEDKEKLRKAWEEGKVADADALYIPEVVEQDEGQASEVDTVT